MQQTSGNIDILRGAATREDAAKFVSQLTPNQSSILHISAEWNHLSFFTEATLLCPPSLLEHTDYAGNTALHNAAGCGSTEVVAFIIEQAKKKWAPPSDDIEEGRLGYKELLRIQNIYGDNALHLAASCGWDEVAKTLVEADPELAKYINYKEESPCFLAALHGRLTIAKLLLNLNIQCSLRGGKHGMTALHAACCYGYNGIFKEILEKRPEMIREGDAIGWTILHYAAQYGSIYHVKKLLERDPLVAYLVGAGGESALHIAAYNGHIGVIKELTRTRPDCWHLVDGKLRTALHLAVLGGREDVVEHILHLPDLRGIEYIADEDGNTPLHLAALCRSKTMMATITRLDLLDYRYADRRVDGLFQETNKEYLTPMDIYMRILPGRGRLVRSLHACFGLKWMQNKAVEEVEEIMKDAKTRLMVNQGAPNAVVSGGELHQLTAPLIATVTFTAGFTMPGGYIQSGGDNQGVAVLLSNLAFKAFVIFDILAFFASIMVVMLQYTGQDKLAKMSEASRARAMGFTTFCLRVALFSMQLAFACGIYVVISKSVGLGLTALLLSICTTIFSIFGPPQIRDPNLSFSMGRRKLWKALKLA